MRRACAVIFWMPWTGCTMPDLLVDDLWVVLPHLGAGGAQKVGGVSLTPIRKRSEIAKNARVGLCELDRKRKHG